MAFYTHHSWFFNLLVMAGHLPVKRNHAVTEECASFVSVFGVKAVKHKCALKIAVHGCKLQLELGVIKIYMFGLRDRKVGIMCRCVWCSGVHFQPDAPSTWKSHMILIHGCPRHRTEYNVDAIPEPNREFLSQYSRRCASTCSECWFSEDMVF